MITINFAGKNYRLLGRLLSVLSVLAALLGMVLIAVIWTAVSIHADAVSLEKKVKELESARQNLAPLLNERARVMKDLTDMSALLELRRFSWIQLLTNIEKAFPIGVSLNSVEFNPRSHALTLDGNAQSPESLRGLIVELERAPVFKEPYLKHQSVDKGSIAFNVVAIYQEHQAAGMASRK